jgi:hypothetical protein
MHACLGQGGRLISVQALAIPRQQLDNGVDVQWRVPFVNLAEKAATVAKWLL